MANKNLMVKALAGTGKTTTMVWSVGSVPRGVKLSDEQQAIRQWFQAQKIEKFRFLAFNKSIADELSKKVPGYCEAATCHSSGFSIIRANSGKLRRKVDSWKYRKIMDGFLGEPKKPEDFQLRNAANQVIDLARVHLLGYREVSVNGDIIQLLPVDLEAVQRNHDLESNVTDSQLLEVCNKALAIGSAIDCQQIDFTDMIWLPVFHNMKATKVGGLIVDECFPAGTKVFTAGGFIPIEYIAAHPEFDWQVLSSVDGGKTLTYSSVTSAYKTPIKSHLVKVKHEKGEIICTANHPFWVNGKGWVPAGLLNQGDSLSNLRKNGEEGFSELLQEMCRGMEENHQGPRSRGEKAGENIQKNEGSQEGNTQPYGESRNQSKGICDSESQRSQTSDSRGQWQRSVETSNDVVSGISSSPSSLAMEPRVCHLQWSTRETEDRASESLQSRYSIFGEDVSDRSGRNVSLDIGKEETRSEENYSTREVRVVSVEIYQQGDSGESGSVCEESNFVYTLSVESGSYFADGLLVKNCQDLNRAQQELVMMQGHQIICVGDVNQAIYGFAGADAVSMERLEKTLGENGGVDVMPLTMTRRCGKKVVELAQRLVPSYKAADTNPEGLVRESKTDDVLDELEKTAKSAEKTTMALCRTNAPLVSLAFRLLRREVPVFIRGKDIGDGLIKLVEKVAGKSNNLDTMIAGLEDYASKEEAKIRKRFKYGAEDKIVALEDKVDCIRVLASDCENVTDLTNKLARLFQDKDSGKTMVLLSSVHKAKGLEADNVYIYRPELLPHPKLLEKKNGQQEFNLQYVAYTRAIHDLVFMTV